MGSGWIGTVSKLPTTVPSSDRVEKVIRTINGSPAYDIPFTIEHSFQNGYPFNISVLFRNGMGFTIPKTAVKWRPCHDFTIFVKYRFTKNVRIDIHHLLDDVSDSATKEIKALRDAFKDSQKHHVFNGNEAVMAYHVSRDTFEKAKGSLYIEELDITIALDQDDVKTRTVHPFSALGQGLTEDIERVLGYNYRIVINDPDNLHGDRFINIGTRVFRVKASIEFGKDPGVYLYVTNDDGVVEEKAYDFESADTELMMYRTASDAKVYGNILETRKRELEEIQHQQKLRVLELENENYGIKMEVEKRMAEIKEERAKMDAEYAKQLSFNKQRELEFDKELKRVEGLYAHEKALREDHMNQQKVRYEERSLDRKDSSEIIKWLPVIMTGGFLVFKKLF